MYKSFGAITLGLLVNASAQALLIDNFATQPQAIIRGRGQSAAATGSVSDGLAVAQVVGGSRDIWVSGQGGAGSPVPGTTGIRGVAVESDGGSFAISNDVGVNSTTYITWDGPSGVGQDSGPNPVSEVNATGLGGVDLSQGGLNRSILIELHKIDLNARIQLTLWDMLGNSFSVVHTYATPTLSDSFALSLFNGVDITKVGAIQIMIADTQTAWDVELGAVRAGTIAEPSIGSLLGVGLSAVAVRGFRKGTPQQAEV